MKEEQSITKYRGTICLNCNHPLDVSDNFCPNCGQTNSVKKLSFDHYINEYFAGFFAYDSRINLTLFTLLFKPGKITKDYVSGKRMRYANPFRFYLSVSIIFFIIFGFSNSYDGMVNTEPQSVSKELSDQEIQDLKKDIDEIPGGTNVNLDSLVALQDIRDTISKKTFKEKLISQSKLDSLSFLNSVSERVDLYNTFQEETKIVSADIAMDSLHHNHTDFNKWLYKKTIDFNLVKDNPKIFVNYVLGKMPLIIFFFLPIVALFIWLLYWRRKFNYMEHLVFVFHVQSVFFVLLGFSYLIDEIFKIGFFRGAAFFIFLFYLYKSMRNFYEQRRFKTIVKFLIINVIFLTLAVIAIIFTLFASFAMF